jgi:hypothetical protein
MPADFQIALTAKPMRINPPAFAVVENFDRVEFPVEIASWLEDEYIHRRNSLAHGIQDILAWRWRAVEPEKHVAFGRLHELVRLSVLGFLSLPDEVIQDHSSLTGPRLQGFLDGLGPVDGEFSRRQKAWCE